MQRRAAVDFNELLLVAGTDRDEWVQLALRGRQLPPGARLKAGRKVHAGGPDRHDVAQKHFVRRARAHAIGCVGLNENHALFVRAALESAAQGVFKFIDRIEPIVNVARRIETRDRQVAPIPIPIHARVLQHRVSLHSPRIAAVVKRDQVRNRNATIENASADEDIEGSP